MRRFYGLRAGLPLRACWLHTTEVGTCSIRCFLWLRCWLSCTRGCRPNCSARELYFSIFQTDQLVFVQTLNVLGILGFVLACLAAGTRLRESPTQPFKLSPASCRRLRIGALLVGSVGLVCWTISIVNVGGFVNAFSKSYSGGWDDSGYVRDGNLLLLVGVLLALGAIAAEGARAVNVSIAILFGLPWLTQALLMARRGPTFALLIIILRAHIFTGANGLQCWQCWLWGPFWGGCRCFW